MPKNVKGIAVSSFLRTSIPRSIRPGVCLKGSCVMNGTWISKTLCGLKPAERHSWIKGRIKGLASSYLFAWFLCLFDPSVSPTTAPNFSHDRGRTASVRSLPPRRFLLHDRSNILDPNRYRLRWSTEEGASPGEARRGPPSLLDVYSNIHGRVGAGVCPPPSGLQRRCVSVENASEIGDSQNDPRERDPALRKLFSG